MFYKSVHPISFVLTYHGHSLHDNLKAKNVTSINENPKHVSG